MPRLFSVQEAAAIGEVSPDTIRTALEKKSITSSSRRKTGKSVRHGFSVRDILLLKMLTEFPFPLARHDKTALRDILVRGASQATRWCVDGPDLVFDSGEIKIFVQCKSMRTRLAHNLAAFRWGKRRITSSPEVLNGEPVFQGTRIPLEHVAGLYRKGVSEREIAEDFPALSPRDLAYARVYARMGAAPGRPRKPIKINRKARAA